MILGCIISGLLFGITNIIIFSILKFQLNIFLISILLILSGIAQSFVAENLNFRRGDQEPFYFALLTTIRTIVILTSYYLSLSFIGGINAIFVALFIPDIIIGLMILMVSRYKLNFDRKYLRDFIVYGTPHCIVICCGFCLTMWIDFLLVR